MLLFWYECKKLLQLPVMIVAVIACILLNLLVCYIYKENEWVDFDAADTASNVFIDYDTSEDAERVIYDNEILGKNAENIRNKYEKLQAVVDEKSENGDSLSHYFGDSTSYRHHVLFGTIFGFLIAECAILMMFAALLSTNYENARNTELFVYATKSGRKIMRIKLLAGLAVGLAVSAVIFTATLANTISTFDFLSVWNDNVSSSFNMLYTDGSPYITWQSFTVGQEFWAYIGVCFVLLISCNLLGYAAGVTFRNGYTAVIVALGFNFLTIFLKIFAPFGSFLRAAVNTMPLWQWKSADSWFTVGNTDVIWKNFECIGIAITFTLFGILSIITYNLFKRRNLI